MSNKSNGGPVFPSGVSFFDPATVAKVTREAAEGGISLRDMMALVVLHADVSKPEDGWTVDAEDDTPELCFERGKAIYMLVDGLLKARDAQ